jgi:hypothetical protein
VASETPDLIGKTRANIHGSEGGCDQSAPPGGTTLPEQPKYRILFADLLVREMSGKIYQQARGGFTDDYRNCPFQAARNP